MILGLCVKEHKIVDNTHPDSLKLTDNAMNPMIL